MTQPVDITSPLRASISVEIDIDTDARNAVLAVHDYTIPDNPRLLGDRTLLTSTEHAQRGVPLEQFLAAADEALREGGFARSGGWTAGVDYLGLWLLAPLTKEA